MAHLSAGAKQSVQYIRARCACLARDFAQTKILKLRVHASRTYQTAVWPCRCETRKARRLCNMRACSFFEPGQDRTAHKCAHTRTHRARVVCKLVSQRAEEQHEKNKTDNRQRKNASYFKIVVATRVVIWCVARSVKLAKKPLILEIERPLNIFHSRRTFACMLSPADGVKYRHRINRSRRHITESSGRRQLIRMQPTATEH